MAIKLEFVHDLLQIVDTNEFQLSQELGAGSLGRTYKGTFKQQPAIIKVLHYKGDNPEVTERLREELKVMACLIHPNIVHPIAFCPKPNNVCIIYDDFPAQTLFEFLSNPSNETPVILQLRIMKEILMGLHWLHNSHPQILFYDLRPQNILVGSDGTIKVCDFGLNDFKLRDQLANGALIPKQPRWTAPSSFMNKPHTSSGDIYSYATICWQILSRQIPFHQHPNLAEFASALCDRKERMPFPRETPVAIVRFIVSCWSDDGDYRPNTSTIIPVIDDLIIQFGVPQPELREIWTKANGGGNGQCCRFTELTRVLQMEFNLGKELATKAYALMRYLISDTNVMDGTPQTTVDQWVQFHWWFGPIFYNDPQFGNCFERFVDLCSMPYFHGIISRIESEELLKNQKKGSWLLRLSTTEPDKTPFTISKVNRESTVIHQRIHAQPSRKGYLVVIKSSGAAPKKIEALGPIWNLIKVISAELSLLEPFPNQIFPKLIQEASQSSNS